MICIALTCVTTGTVNNFWLLFDNASFFNSEIWLTRLKKNYCFVKKNWWFSILMLYDIVYGILLFHGSTSLIQVYTKGLFLLMSYDILDCNFEYVILSILNLALFLYIMFWWMSFSSIKEINRLSKKMSCIYLRVSVEKNWCSQNFDFLRLKNLSPGPLFGELQLMHI